MADRLVLPATPRQPQPRQTREVSQWLHDYILRRDRFCMGYRIYGSNHICRDRWGNPHAAHDTSKLTLGHTKTALAMGKRAPSDARHLVAECWAFNCKPPNKEEREAERAYLLEVEP